jgi:hypothetical protein
VRIVSHGAFCFVCCCQKRKKEEKKIHMHGFSRQKKTCKCGVLHKVDVDIGLSEQTKTSVLLAFIRTMPFTRDSLVRTNIKYWSFLMLFGGAVQCILYGTYFSPQYRVLDAFTKAMAEALVAAFIMGVTYPWAFSCQHASLTHLQRFAGAMFFASLVFVTAMRMGLPTWFMILAVTTPALSSNRIWKLSENATALVYLLVGCLLSALTTTYFLMTLTGDETSKFWTHPISEEYGAKYGANQSTMLGSYIIVSIILCVNILLFHSVREQTLHVSHALRDGTLVAALVLTILWLFSFAPSFSVDNVIRFGISSRDHIVTEAIFVLFMSAILKLILTGIFMESIKRGLTFSVGVSITAPYILLNLGVGTLGNMGPAYLSLSTLGLIALIILAMWIETRCHTRQMDNDDARCNLCRENKRVCGLFYPFWTCMERAKEQVKNAKDGVNAGPHAIIEHHSVKLDEFDDDDETILYEKNKESMI